MTPKFNEPSKVIRQVVPGAMRFRQSVPVGNTSWENANFRASRVRVPEGTGWQKVSVVAAEPQAFPVMVIPYAVPLPDALPVSEKLKSILMYVIVPLPDWTSTVVEVSSTFVATLKSSDLSEILMVHVAVGVN